MMNGLFEKCRRKFASSYSLITQKHSVFKGISYNKVVQGEKFIGVSAYILKKKSKSYQKHNDEP